ncbi:MAG: FHA domain-containing protein, partial [bacterium]|nr:FHA domain-containing protein [bacterium]
MANPSGHRTRVPLNQVPFHIGRQADNDIVIRDNRASRRHARIVAEDGEYWVEDLGSQNGVYINGRKVDRNLLTSGDVLSFGVADSYELTFQLDEGELTKLLGQFPAPSKLASAGAQNLEKLRAVIEVARALQSSLTIEEVLDAVVDAALTVTSCERGFLLLRSQDDLDIRVARDHGGTPIPKDELHVPTRLIGRALSDRRELLSMNFDPASEQGVKPEGTVAHLELRSVVCVPLVRVRTGNHQETVHASLNDTVGLIYLDSKGDMADLSSGNRELLQSLAIEASTVLENARLLDEERAKQKLEEELSIARTIQQYLLPKQL